MKYSAIVPFGLSLSAVLSVSLAPAPATAATITLGYETTVNGSVIVSPTLAGLFSIAPGPTVYNDKFYQGQFQVSDAVQAQALSGGFSASFLPLATVLNLPASVISQNTAFLSALNINFTGSAKITSMAGISNIDFSYNNASQRLNVTNYAQNVLASCLVGECQFETNSPVNWTVVAPNFSSTPLIGGQLSYRSRTTPIPLNSLFTSNQNIIALQTSIAPDVPPAMPTPAMLPGLIGMGISLWRRKRSALPS